MAQTAIKLSNCLPIDAILLTINSNAKHANAYNSITLNIFTFK